MVTELTIEQRDRTITLPITLKSGVGAAAPRRTRRAADFEPVRSGVNTNDSFHKGPASVLRVGPLGAVEKRHGSGRPAPAWTGAP